MNRKKIIIVIIILLFFIVIALLMKYLYPNINFELNGNYDVQLSLNTNYIDSGYEAYLDNGMDLSDYVTVINNVDTNMTGEYEIIYNLKYRLVSKELIRKVNVIANDNEKITLFGENPYYLLKDEEYIEKGYSSTDGTNIEVINNIDNTTRGNYYVKYSYINNGIEVVKYRNVIVYDVYCVMNTNPSYNTPNSVNIDVTVADNDFYDYIVLPDLTISNNLNVTYTVKENGVYTFLLVDVFGNKKRVMYEVNNILDNYSCNAFINYQGTTLSLNGIIDDNVDSITWNIDGNLYNVNDNKYHLNKSIKSASVTLKYRDNLEYKAECNITDNLLYHFKYDENNTKPFMNCKTYNSSDKTRLDNLLRDVINEVGGSGTRAGAVAAARFLVGGLDYKVPYLGPKNRTIDPDHILGVYEKKGLNIGNDTSWGCHVHGWTQGIDCTGFVSWVFSQIDFKDNLYGSNNTFKVRDVINEVQVGDTLLAPKNSSNIEFQHIGIIIGIDDKYFYVAESTTGSINAIVVTKMDKYNMPSGIGKFSIVKKIKYPKEGNVTNMWVE